MRKTHNKPSDSYSPLYFLVSLGAGGLVVTFFMWLMHWISSHPSRPVPVFEDIVAAFVAGGIPMRVMIIAAVAGIALCAFLNINYLAWNLSQYRTWKQTEA